MGKYFNIEVRDNCKMCGDPLPKGFRTYCSKKCRTRALNIRHSEAHTKWQRKQRDKIASKPSKEKIQCLLCNKWYKQVGSHIVRVHKMTAREYRKMVGFDVKRGQLPPEYRKLKSDQAFECGGVKNLKQGKKYWFKKGQKGVGVYTRSAQTLERLRTKHKKK